MAANSTPVDRMVAVDAVLAEVVISGVDVSEVEV